MNKSKRVGAELNGNILLTNLMVKGRSEHFVFTFIQLISVN